MLHVVLSFVEYNYVYPLYMKRKTSKFKKYFRRWTRKLFGGCKKK
jgi:hypothetical protein